MKSNTTGSITKDLEKYRGDSHAAIMREHSEYWKGVSVFRQELAALSATIILIIVVSIIAGMFYLCWVISLNIYPYISLDEADWYLNFLRIIISSLPSLLFLAFFFERAYPLIIKNAQRLNIIICEKLKSKSKSKSKNNL